MANLTKEEIIKRGYLTDVSIANSNVDVDSDLFKAHITDRFIYDTIYGGCNKPVIEEVVEIQEPITIVEEVVEHHDVVETSTESVLLEEDLKEKIEEPAVVEPVAVEPTAEVKDEEDPVEPGATEDEE